MFKKKETTSNLLRVYLSPPAGRDRIVLADLLRSAMVSATDPDLGMSINYDDERPLVRRPELRQQVRYADLEYVLVSGPQEFLFSFSIESAREARVYELTRQGPSDPTFSKELEVLGNLGDAFEIHSAYARPVSSRMSPGTETRFKRGFFGISVKVPARHESWLMPDEKVSSGALRGVYPLNYWSAAAFDHVRQLGLPLPEPSHMAGRVWSLDDSHLRAIAKSNARVAKFVHLGAEG